MRYHVETPVFHLFFPAWMDTCKKGRDFFFFFFLDLITLLSTASLTKDVIS